MLNRRALASLTAAAAVVAVMAAAPAAYAVALAATPTAPVTDNVLNPYHIQFTNIDYNVLTAPAGVGYRQPVMYSNSTKVGLEFKYLDSKPIGGTWNHFNADNFSPVALSTTTTDVTLTFRIIFANAQPLPFDINVVELGDFGQSLGSGTASGTFTLTDVNHPAVTTTVPVNYSSLVVADSTSTTWTGTGLATIVPDSNGVTALDVTYHTILNGTANVGGYADFNKSNVLFSMNLPVGGGATSPEPASLALLGLGGLALLARRR